MLVSNKQGETRANSFKCNVPHQYVAASSPKAEIKSTNIAFNPSHAPLLKRKSDKFRLNL